MTAVLLLAAAMIPAASELYAGGHPIPRGCLVGNHAYTLGEYRAGRRGLVTRTVGPDAPRQIVGRAVLGRPGGELFYVSSQSSRWTTRRVTPMRFQVARGALYFVAVWDANYIPVFGAPLGPLVDPMAVLRRLPLDADTLALMRVTDDLDEYTRMKLARDQRFGLGGVHGRRPSSALAPYEELFGRGIGHPRTLPKEQWWFIHFDILFGPDGNPELYVSSPGRLERFRSIIDRRADRPEWSWHIMDACPPGWVGPFYVVADGDDRHFVVPGGRVFTLPADAPPDFTLVKTWDADSILALVHDTDAGKSYAFTKSHYFHLTAKPDPKPHGLTAFSGATADEALDTVAKCGRVIRGLK